MQQVDDRAAAQLAGLADEADAWGVHRRSVPRSPSPEHADPLAYLSQSTPQHLQRDLPIKRCFRNQLLASSP